jgi:hypothetical protein
MFNAAPTVFFGTSYSSNGTALSIPIAAFPELSSAEASATTGAGGDSRKVIFALLHRIHSVFNGLATANRPTKMTVSRTIGAINANNEFTTSFTFSFNLEATGVDVAAE